ncbi:MAG: FAD-binding oxidoreductase [Dehalococcoidia bacterium]
MPDAPSSASTPPAGAAKAVDAAAFRAALGGDAVDSAATAEFTVDGLEPALVLRPTSITGVAAAVREAQRQGRAVVLHGGRTAIAVGNPPRRYDVAIGLQGLAALSAYEPDDFTVTVQAGMRFADFQAALAQQGQFLPLDPPQPERATVGGVIALGRGGPRRAARGTVRDWLIGCSVILANGTRINAGGRVVKNVSGYDLPKLFAGSLGTLGCIVEATFKLRPLPARDETLVLPCADFAAALDLGREVVQKVNGLDAVVALDRDAAGLVNVDGAALLVRAMGMQRAVATLLDAVRSQAGTAPVPTPSDAAFWRHLSGLEAPDVPTGRTLLRCGVVPSRLQQLAAAVADTLPDARRWSYSDGGLLFAESPSVTADAVNTLRENVAALGGTLIVDAAPPALKAEIDVWGPSPGGVSIMRRLKERYDPQATLSPGRFVGGI